MPLLARFAVTSLALLVACGGEKEPTDETDTPTTPITEPATLPDDVPEEGPATVAAYASGWFSVLPSFTAGGTVWGQAVAVKRLDGTSGVGFTISGLAGNTEHSAHVHALPCSADAGGHYLVDPALPAGEENEIWPTFTTDADGNGNVWLELPMSLRGDAMSVVVHDPASASKYACADLYPEEPVGALSEGDFASFAYAEPVDETIGGHVSMTTTSNATTLDADFTGLDPTAEYVGHVHAQPCEVLDGAGHYKFDPLVVDTLATNEIWLSFVPGPEGGATTTVDVPGHVARSDAQAVVIHRVVAPDTVPKVACANLWRASSLPLRRGGPATALNGSTVTGSASLERRMDGATIVSVDLEGLTAGAEHPVHLHMLPCGVLEGGGHTLIDPAAPPGPDNELWINVVGDSMGYGKRSVGVPYTVGADAQSVVVHAPDSSKLACIDLR